MRNPKTTAAGLLTIAGAAFTFVGHWVATGSLPPPEQWSILGGALTVGAGLIAAADGRKKENQDQ